MNTAAERSSTPLPLILDADDQEALLCMLRAASPQQDYAKTLIARIEQGGDEIIVQAGMEGGVIQGWTANVPATCLAIDWRDESPNRLVVIDDSPQLLTILQYTPEVDPASAALRASLAEHSIVTDFGDRAAVIKKHSGEYILYGLHSTRPVEEEYAAWVEAGLFDHDDVAWYKEVVNRNGKVVVLQTYDFAAMARAKPKANSTGLGMGS